MDQSPQSTHPSSAQDRLYGAASPAAVAINLTASIPRRGWNRRWRLRCPESASINAAPLAGRILAARNLTSPEFLAPKLTQLHDPSLIPDLDKAAHRLSRALADGEQIAIYGDYDVDGITATAILYHTFKAIAPDSNIISYIPHRDEGYGLNTAAIGQLAAGGARVIVSVDCGITAGKEAIAARELGVDLIITDHHNPPATLADLPDAYAVVHPRRPDSSYPFGDLSGAGVAYKLAWRLATLSAGGQSETTSGRTERASPALRALLVELLAFAALGAVADIVPLIGENRVITRYGMERIRHSPMLGLKALLHASGLTGEKVGAWDVGFKLAPRLNACGRMNHARAAVELFTTTNAGRANTIAEELNRANAERQAVERRIAAEAADLAVAAGMTTDGRRAIVLADTENRGWQKGVVGIVCSRLVELYCRPTLLLCMETEGEYAGICHGSGRSIEGFNLHAALHACRDLLVSFGGHNMAAGLRVTRENLPAFIERFTNECNAAITTEELTRHVSIDATTTVDALTLKEVREIESLAPFGAGNPGVNILLRGCRLDGLPAPMGKSGEHLSLQLRGPTATSRVIRAVGWRWGKERPRLATGMTIDAVVRPQINTYNGRENVEVELIDLAVCD